MDAYDVRCTSHLSKPNENMKNMKTQDTKRHQITHSRKKGIGEQQYCDLNSLLMDTKMLFIQLNLIVTSSFYYYAKNPLLC